MTETERNNWKLIKETMEAKGTTDNMFYTRACAIIDGKEDPLSKLK